MVKLHSVAGKAKTSYGVYMSSSLIDRTGWQKGHTLRVTVVDREMILVTSLMMSKDQLVELYNAATAGKPVYERPYNEITELLSVTVGDDGRRPATITTLSPLGSSGYRIVITNAVNRLGIPIETEICRRTGLGIAVLVPLSARTEEVRERVQSVLEKREVQISKPSV